MRKATSCRQLQHQLCHVPFLYRKSFVHILQQQHKSWGMMERRRKKERTYIKQTSIYLYSHSIKIVFLNKEPLVSLCLHTFPPRLRFSCPPGAPCRALGGGREQRGGLHALRTHGHIMGPDIARIETKNNWNKEQIYISYILYIHIFIVNSVRVHVACSSKPMFQLSAQSLGRVGGL